MSRSRAGYWVAGISRTAGQCAFGLIALSLVLLPLPVGANRLWAVMGFALFAYVALALALLSWVLHPRREAEPLPLLCFLTFAAWIVWLGWIWLQTITLDSSALRWLAPHQEALYTALATAHGSAAGLTYSISVDAEQTRQHWLESAAYFALFTGVWLLCGGDRRRRLTLLWIVFLSGIAQAVYGSLMTLSGLEYGAFTRKIHYLGSATGTFVNRNHFAGYMELSLACGLGLLVAHSQAAGGNWRETLRNWLISGGKATAVRLLLMFLVIGLITSKSRGGNAAALAGFGTTLIVMLVLSRGGLSWRRGAVLLVSFLLVDVMVLGSWFGGGLMERYLATAPETEYRLGLWPDLMRMTQAYGWGGSGLGTFALAYPEFHSIGVLGSPQEAHNDYLQFWVETGVIGVAILSVLILSTLLHILRVLRNRRDPPALAVAAAALAALTSLAVHSSTDFNLQIPANAATLVTLLGLAWTASPRKSERRRRRGLNPESGGTRNAIGRFENAES